jgi:hypothetical protein
MTAHADAPAAGPTNIAGRERNVHEGAIGPVIVVPPDEALLVSKHRPPAGATLLGFGDPARGLSNILGFEACDASSLIDGYLIRISGYFRRSV